MSEWNCDDCAFQANCASELMKHLKVTSHQPSKNVSDKRKVFEDYKQCYTCKMDFDGYYNLMNHRKIVHPSSKKCKNFPRGECNFGSGCWYVHDDDEKMDTEDTFDNFKCDVCEEEFKGRTNFMRHKKLSHPQNVPVCEKYSARKCPRIDQDCWFEHRPSALPDGEKTPQSRRTSASQSYADASRKSVFREVLGQALPPDQMEKMINLISNLCNKVQSMEKRFEDLMN